MASNNFNQTKDFNYTGTKATRSGLTPDETELPFSITTSMVASYLQKKLDVIANRIAKENGTTANTDDGISIRLYTTEAGKSFLPFVVILPMEALEDTGKKRKKMASIFDTKSEDGSATLKKEYYELFKTYIYNEDDEKAFFSDDWRRSRHVNRETSPVLKSLRKPKVTSMEGGRLQVISFMIDPLRVFHDMLTMENDKRSFRVDVVKWQKIQTGEYRYDVNRVVNKKNKQKYKDTLAAELNRKIKGGR